jgi:hypothetical protein
VVLLMPSTCETGDECDSKRARDRGDSICALEGDSTVGIARSLPYGPLIEEDPLAAGKSGSSGPSLLKNALRRLRGDRCSLA